MKFTTTTLLAQGALTAAAATAGDLTILTMNVAGLPAILNPNDVAGGKKAAAKTIGSKFAQYGYDVIHVQEVSFFVFCQRWLGIGKRGGWLVWMKSLGLGPKAARSMRSGKREGTSAAGTSDGRRV